MPFPLLAVAVTSAIGSGSSIGMSMFSFNRINNAQKKASSNVADEVEQDMQELLRQYMNKANRTTADKNQALMYFDSLWNELTSKCASIGGNAGANCVRDRMRGGKFDWFQAYRSPIENDMPRELTTTEAISGQFQQDVGLDLMTVGMIALVGVGAIMFMRSK